MELLESCIHEVLRGLTGIESIHGLLSAQNGGNSLQLNIHHGTATRGTSTYLFLKISSLTIHVASELLLRSQPLSEQSSCFSDKLICWTEYS